MSLRPSRPNTVKIDGNEVRRVREAKGLTQLYVAEVAKVSVDTVSRWENNRTQTVRTENAEALAEALEVELKQILLVDDQAEQVPARPQGRRRPIYLGAALAMAALTLLLAGGWFFLHEPQPQLETFRRVPAYTAPGARVPVIVSMQVVSGTVRRLVLREQIPPDWTFVGSIPPPDHGPDKEGEVRWILPVEEGRAEVAYVLEAPSDADEGSIYHVRGEIVTPAKDSRGKPVGGESRIDLEFIHWADEDGDFRVGDAELLNALERIEATQKLGMDTRVLRTLWGAGEYEWIAGERRFKPRE